MPAIQQSKAVVTQITTVALDPKNQSEALELMKERAKFMATQPGFVSISLHQSAENGRIACAAPICSADFVSAH